MRTKRGLSYWNDDAIKFLEYDMAGMISLNKKETIDSEFLQQQENSEKNNEISNQYLISLVGFIYETKHLFPSELTEKVFEFIKEHLKLEKLSITEKFMLCDFSEIMTLPLNITGEIENMNETEFFKACSDFAFYNMAFTEVTEKLHPLLQSKFDAVMETETAQKHLFDCNEFGLTGLSGFYPFIMPVKTENDAVCTNINMSKSKNLYIFNETSRAAVYGIGSYVNELTSCLKNVDGMNINIVSLNSDTNNEFCITDNDGIKEWKIPASKYHNYDYYQNVIFLLKHYITDIKNIIFHLNYWSTISLLDKLKEVFHCKVVFAIHYMSWGFSLNGNLLHLKTILSEAKDDLNETEKNIRTTFDNEKKLLEKVDSIISLANYTSDILCNEYGIERSKITTIYNGLRAANHLTHGEKLKLKKKYRIARQEKIILFAGRLDPIKGVDKLINAFKKVLEYKPESRLIIAGEGNFSEYLKLSEDVCFKITFTGRIDRTKLFELYSIADIGVMPSTHEQCSYTAIEMMMHGLPLIAASTTGLTEMVEHNVSGIIIPIEEQIDKIVISEDLLSEQILCLLNNPETLRKMRKQSRKRFLDYYINDVMRKNIIVLYNKVFEQM
jgi:glycosyltransferase